MKQISDINILICDRDPEYSQSIYQILFKLGLKKIFYASSHVELEQICNNYSINMALIDSEFNGMGGFATGQELIEKNPDLIIFYITNPKKIMDPIRSLFFGGVNFIFRDNQEDLFHKLTTWINIILNSLYVRELINE